MSEIVPTVTAFEAHAYREQIDQIAPFSTRVHIDLMDGRFAPSVSVAPEQVWWPHHMRADIHLMFDKPAEQLDALIELNPRLVIIHAEAKVDHRRFAEDLHDAGILCGVSILQDTQVKALSGYIDQIDHVLVFSGNLGFHGGTADLGLLSKVAEARTLKPTLEIGWDGGIDDNNIDELIAAGVDILNVGGYIQKSPDPQKAYATLQTSLKEEI